LISRLKVFKRLRIDSDGRFALFTCRRTSTRFEISSIVSFVIQGCLETFSVLVLAAMACTSCFNFSHSSGTLSSSLKSVKSLTSLRSLGSLGSASSPPKSSNGENLFRICASIFFPQAFDLNAFVPTDLVSFNTIPIFDKRICATLRQ
jgi:hypothetical protein